MENLTLNQLAEKQWDWVERNGWHNKTVLEYIALICSEIGEAANECRGEKPTIQFGIELADIILRTLDLAKVCDINIEECIDYKIKLNEINGTKGRLK
jgi:NTP pyrophosphatase (non-canonical NTP hydrolase)